MIRHSSYHRDAYINASVYFHIYSHSTSKYFHLSDPQRTLKESKIEIIHSISHIQLKVIVPIMF